LSSYLSGLLIGHELRAALAAFPAPRVALVGAPALTQRYRAALEREGRASVTVPGDAAAAKGLWRIAEKAGYFTS
jgi:2-dehydro-3-deoxygalactonokinase